MNIVGPIGTSPSAGSIEAAPICTFYSYKGGVGRSMALANIAALLAKLGQKVLIVDWDLEAPGIEKYFESTSTRSGAAGLSGRRSDTPGLVDLVLGFADGSELDWRKCLVHANIPRSPHIDILHAGKDDEKYSDRLRSINWEALFKDQEKGFGVYLDGLRRQWKIDYDFVLVDSRTGITDIGGICTIFLPDVLIAMFTANEQSLAGVKDVIRRAHAGRKQLALDRERLVIVPLSARDETANEYELAEKWRKKFASELKDAFADWIPAGENAERILNYIKIPYFAYWSFGERLPVLEEDPDNPKNLAFSYQLIARLLHSKLNWGEVLEGSRATEAQATQEAQADRQAAEAAKLREQAQSEAAAREAEARRAEQVQLQERIEKFMRSRYWPLVAFSRRMRWLGLSLSAVGAVITIYATFWLVYYVAQIGLFVSADGTIGPVLSGMLGCMAFLVGWRLVRRHSRMLSWYASEWSKFEAGLDSYASLPPSSAFVQFAEVIESIVMSRGLGSSATIADSASSSRSGRPVFTPGVDGPPLPAPSSRASRDAPPPPNYSPPPSAADPGPYDVFMSYTPTHLTSNWMREFIPLFTAWLGEALGREARVYSGQWAPAFEGVSDLSRTMLEARCMVAILTPSYFASEFSRKEWDTFATSHSDRLLPVVLHKGGSYPAEADHYQSFDLSDFAYVGEGFTKTERYVEFQQKIRELVDVVAAKIRTVSEGEGRPVPA